MHFRKRREFLSFTAIVIFLCKTCTASLLGIASDYSAFIFGPVNLYNSDAGGGIAAKGDITFTSYSSGRNKGTSQHTVISNGSVICTNGEIYNGGLYSGNNTGLQGTLIQGDIATRNNFQ